MALSTSTSRRQPSQEEIAERARKIWQERGSPGGRDLEHWLDAEQQLDAESRAANASRDGRKDLDEAEKRLDGLIEPPPTPARRTPAGENL